MTPNPTKEEMQQRHVFDPAPKTIHVKDLVTMAKDGIYNRDILSSQVVGMLLLSVKLNVIATWEAQMFQVPFTRNARHRVNAPMYGRPFIGPDDMIVTLDGLALRGGENWYKLHENPGESPLDLDGIKAHPLFNAWKNDVLFCGSSGTYKQQTANRNIREVDTHVNASDYTPGPNSVPRSTLNPAPKVTVRRTPALKKGNPAKAPKERATSSPSTSNVPHEGSDHGEEEEPLQEEYFDARMTF